MITIGYSTRKHNPDFITHLKKTCGLKNIQVIEKINNDKFFTDLVQDLKNKKFNVKKKSELLRTLMIR